jgi:ABC-type uncharacterized transport system involved in gliding motility auxiliary subunit
MRARFLGSILGVIAVAAIAIGVNMFADSRLADRRIDLTAQRLYTLSPGTKQILAGLKEPITLRLFYSRRLGGAVPLYGTYSDRVRKMLNEYASAANGRVKLEFLDPEPFSDTEDHAMAYGLQGVPVDQSGEQVYFGLVGNNLLDDERTIGFFQPERERFLEYDLTRLVYELSNPTRPMVGVMSSLPLDGDPRMMMRGGPGGQPYAAMLALRQTNQVKPVAPDARAIDPDIQVLLVAEAQNLSDATLYAIDQFVMRGGRLMAMVDPYSEALSAMPSPTGMPPEDTGANLKKLFDAWGIGFDPSKVVADPTGAWRVRANPDDRVQAVDYLAWFNIQNGISHDDPATADLQQVTVASSGYLTKKDNAAIEFTPLLTSSTQSGLIPVEQVKMPDPARILADFKSDGVARVIAARVRGKLHSAFTGPPSPAEGQQPAENPPPFKAETDGPANLVLVADSDILADRYWVRVQDFFGEQQATPFSDNGAFVANLIDTLGGGDALIGLRSRGASIRPFALVQRMQAGAEATFRQSERELQQHLDDTEKQLRELRGGSAGKDQVVITPEQRAAIDTARTEIVNTRKKLRAVQLELNRDISRLDTELRVADIVLAPALLAMLAIGLGIARNRRRARARA